MKGCRSLQIIARLKSWLSTISLTRSHVFSLYWDNTLLPRFRHYNLGRDSSRADWVYQIMSNHGSQLLESDKRYGPVTRPLGKITPNALSTGERHYIPLHRQNVHSLSYAVVLNEIPYINPRVFLFVY